MRGICLSANVFQPQTEELKDVVPREVRVTLRRGLTPRSEDYLMPAPVVNADRGAVKLVIAMEKSPPGTPDRDLFLMGLGRVELPTSRLSGVRSNHLSYRPFLELGVGS